MLASTSLVLASLTALANAHFQLQFPGPRGPFVEDSEPTFCDGYDNETTNRTAFPLTGGFLVLNSEHSSWTAAVALTTKPNASDFSDFLNVVPFAKHSGEGPFCLSLDFSKTNATGLTEGQNVTIEVIFDGGDGQLYQCADMTLTNTAKIDPSVTCNGTAGASIIASATSAAGSAAGSATAPGSSPSTTAPSGSALGLRSSGGYVSLLLGLVGIVAVVA